MDYHGLITGSGADKLAASKVAPLVAAAQGFKTLEKENLKPFIERLGVAHNSALAKQTRAAVGDREALIMPWYSPQDVIEQGRAQDFIVRETSLQLRPHPANAKTDEKGKKRKYENLIGQALTFNINPATPASWLTGNLRHLLICEGVIKASAALTAWLEHHGKTELDIDPDTTQLQAVNRLRAIMETIDEPLVILSIIGVGTWHKNPEWNTLRLDGGETWIAFDGDVATNPNVWTQANQMFSFLQDRKKTVPMLVDLGGQLTASGEKMGVDDYLAEGHSFTDLLGHIRPTLPPQPEGVDDGTKYRMNNTKCVMEEKTTAVINGATIIEWTPKSDLIASIVRIEEKREVTQQEEKTGIYDDHISARDVDADAVVKIEWEEAGIRHTSLVEGPATILASKPERWTDPRLGVAISSDVLSHPSWPPTANGWLEAAKLNRREDIERNAAFTHMGWVPRKNATPGYIVGSQVIIETGEADEEASLCGVTEKDLAGVSNFGVGIPDDDEQARDDVRTMMDMLSKCWTDQGNFAVVLATALRPTVPLPCNIPLYLSGASGAGKSWTSAAIMGFWQSYPGAWTDKRLPGSASDTQAATEIALSKTPIWVSDDHAPSSANPRAQAERTEAVNQTIRNIHNGAAKRRATNTMGSQKTNHPRALYVVSAESAPLDDQSIMNRMVHVEVAKGFLVPSREPTDAVEKWNRSDMCCARVTGRVLMMLAGKIRRHTWPVVVAEWVERQQERSAEIGDIIEETTGDPNTSKRQAETVASMMLGLEVLADLMVELDIYDEYADTMTSLFAGLQAKALEGFTENKRLDLGNRFFEDVRMLLRSGQAHISALGTYGAPCNVGEGEVQDARHADAINQALGWELTGDPDRPAVARGESIGWLVTKNDKYVVLFDDAAFQLTQRKVRNRGGLNTKSAWDAVWKCGIPVPEEEGWKRKPRPGRVPDYRVRVKQNGVPVEGVPVWLSKVVGSHED